MQLFFTRVWLYVTSEIYHNLIQQWKLLCPFASVIFTLFFPGCELGCGNGVASYAQDCPERDVCPAASWYFLSSVGVFSTISYISHMFFPISKSTSVVSDAFARYPVPSCSAFARVSFILISGYFFTKCLKRVAPAFQCICDASWNELLKTGVRNSQAIYKHWHLFLIPFVVWFIWKW